jgi:stress-induced morphogen
VQTRRVRFLLIAMICGLWTGGLLAQANPKPAEKTDKGQTVLGPGLYVFQTRTRDSTCGDAEPDGYVLTFFAAIHGIPHAVSMKMELVNTAYFKDWQLSINNNSQIVGQSRIGTSTDGPESHFDVKLEGDRFKGTGARTYNSTVNGKKVRCQVNYDALVRRLD